MNVPPPTVPASIFEALFIRALEADDALKSVIAREGVDLDRLSDSYPADTMRRCVLAAAAHLYPGRPAEDSHRQLGRKFSEGFRNTLVGSVVAVSLPLLGPDRVMARLPRMWTVGQNFGKAEAVQRGPGDWVFQYNHSEHPGLPILPWFNAGAIECALGWTKVTPTVEVESAGGPAYTLSVRW